MRFHIVNKSLYTPNTTSLQSRITNYESRITKPLSILNYAVNGLGLGHISRLIAINRWIRRISSVLGVNAEIAFLTTSECDTIAYHNGFASFKIPSKNIIRESGLQPIRYRRMAKQWVWNAINLFSPDMLIVDTFPGGSFHELYDVFDLIPQNVFVYREVREELAMRTEFQKALSAYDRIITTSEQEGSRFYIPEQLEGRTAGTGHIMLRERGELLSREHAREQLGLRDDDTVCYLTSGGGGDTASEELFRIYMDVATKLPDLRFVIGAGPLYRGPEFHAPNVRWFSRYNAIEYMSAYDFAISAGGYNTVNELMYCGVPSAFFAQHRMYDDQLKRIEALAKRGACLVLQDLTERSLRMTIQQLLDTLLRSTLTATSSSIISRNHASDAAETILGMRLPEDDIDHALALLGGDFFYRNQELGITEQQFLSTIHILDINRRLLKRRMKTEHTGGYGEIMEFDSYTLDDEDDIREAAVEYLAAIEQERITTQSGIRYLRHKIRVGEDQFLPVASIVTQSLDQLRSVIANDSNPEERVLQYLEQAS